MADNTVGGGACLLTCRHALAREFPHRIVDLLMERCFSARFPSEDRSEGDAPIGVLVGRNGGRRKILSKKVFDSSYGFREAS